MTTRSKDGGFCWACQREIAIGDKTTEPVRGAPVYHADCADKPPHKGRVMEHGIASVLVRDALAAGYMLAVNNGEDETKPSADYAEIAAAMFATDEDYLVFVKDGKRKGWVRFIYGNGGWDVVSDYTTNLEHIMGGANALSDRYSEEAV